MKSYKKLAKITFILLFFIALIWSVFYFLKKTYKVEGEAKLVEMNLPVETQNIKFGIDDVRMAKLRWKDALWINGWVFKQNVKEKEREVYLVLKSKNSTLVFEIKNDNKNRPDVSKYFNMDGGINNHGFELSVPMYLLKERTYQVGFVILDETGKYFSMSSKEIRISDDGVKVSGSESESEGKVNSDRVSIKLKIPTLNIKNNFETVSLSNNNLIIKGWGCLEGMNSDFLKSYILLKKNETVAVFSTSVKIRKDVTVYFKKTGLNLDSAGFSAQVAVENLEKGHYQVGLYIERGNQTGMIYSDKYVDIVK